MPFRRMPVPVPGSGPLPGSPRRHALPAARRGRRRTPRACRCCRAASRRFPVAPARASWAACTPCRAAAPACMAFVGVPKLARRPPANEAAIARACPAWPVVSPSIRLATAAAPSVPTVLVACQPRAVMLVAQGEAGQIVDLVSDQERVEQLGSGSAGVLGDRPRRRPGARRCSARARGACSRPSRGCAWPPRRGTPRRPGRTGRRRTRWPRHPGARSAARCDRAIRLCSSPVPPTPMERVSVSASSAEGLRLGDQGAGSVTSSASAASAAPMPRKGPSSSRGHASASAVSSRMTVPLRMT